MSFGLDCTGSLLWTFDTHMHMPVILNLQPCSESTRGLSGASNDKPRGESLDDAGQSHDLSAHVIYSTCKGERRSGGWKTLQ